MTTTKSTEATINDALGEALAGFGRGWSVRHEDTGAMPGGRRPDILIEKGDGYPIVIEAEVDNHAQAEAEAAQRLGEDIVGGHPIHAVIALVYPQPLRQYSGKALRRALADATFEYAMITLEADATRTRFPTAGWLRGDATALAALVHGIGAPASLVDKLAADLGVAVNNAVYTLTLAYRPGSNKSMAGVMGQADDMEGQTRRMAMAVVANAMTFHAILAGSDMEVKDKDSRRRIKPPHAIRYDGHFLVDELCDEWQRILQVNYWPIFYFAREIILGIDTATATKILGALWSAAKRMISSGTAKSHDLTGIVFQRMIKDRQFLAAYYTRPSSAALLAGLALPSGGRDWADANALSSMRIGDFSCGTGTLLSTAYQRFGMLHEIAGGDPGKLHANMMENGLAGLDVLNIAVHLTSSMLAGAHPQQPFAGDCLLTMPYGGYAVQGKTNGISIGSLELLREDIEARNVDAFPVMEAAARVAGGSGDQQRPAHEYAHKVRHDSFDLVIMNPPFTRATAHEGEVKDTHNPAFAAFEATPAEQKLMTERAKRLAVDSAGHGNAGLGSYFIDLGHRKAKPGGVLALVLPLSALSGSSWAKVRSLWRERYSDITVVTTADGSSFSADTSIAECVFVGKKNGRDKKTTTPEAVFVALERSPDSAMEGGLLATEIERMASSGSIGKLESGAFGGAPIKLGNEIMGEMLRCALPADGRPWPVVGVKQMSLAQAAYRLQNGILQFDERMGAQDLPVCRVADLCRRDDNGKPMVGPVHRDITGKDKDPRGKFRGPFIRMQGASKGDAFPMLWAHDAERERRMAMQPDSHGRVHGAPEQFYDDYAKKAKALWDKYASTLHYSLDTGFGAQSILVAVTPPAIGGRAWPSVVLGNKRHAAAFALWHNSTFGLLSHWWGSNRAQKIRGSVTVKSMPALFTVDARKLTPAKLQAAERVFKDLADKPLLPLNQCAEDPVRAEIDRRLLEEVLGLPAAVANMDRLRHMLGDEPGIHGGKKSKVVFTANGEEARQTR